MTNQPEGLVTRAAVYYGPGDLRIEPYALAPVGPDEVLVRVSCCGVCGSDANEFHHGPILAQPPVVMGHEFVGTVVEVGDQVTGLATGATVVCGAGVSCGKCGRCREGRTNLCVDYYTAGFHVAGGLAGHTVVPASTLLDVSDAELPVDTLALAQPMAIAVHAVRRSALQAGDVALIVGVGGIGALLTFVAAARGAEVVAVDVNPAKLELARQLGARHTLAIGEAELGEFLGAAGLVPQVLFEASGSAAGLAQVLAVAPRGATIVPVGVQREASSLSLASWTLREYTVVGTVAHVVSQDLPEAVELLARPMDWSLVAPRVIDLDRLLSHGLIPLSDGTAEANKMLIDPWIDQPRAAVHQPNPRVE